jgi:tricorn protease
VDEWRQMFDDAWRMHREFSFDPAMRGQDWSQVRARYAPLLARVNDRSELDDLLAQMMSELGILHSQVRGAPLRADPEAPQAAALGAQLAADAQGVRVARIYRTDPELPSERAPLQQPGVDARDGDRLLAINGHPVRTVGDVADRLRQQAGQQVLLTLKRGAAPEHRTVVAPVRLDRDATLRYGDWVETNRAAVSAASGGRIGYLHLRAMGVNDMATFVREFYANVEREGLIIDVRRNRGGNIDSWVIEKLLRRAWAFWQPARAAAYPNMQQSFRGHLAVLADQFTYSDGETFAAGIKALKLGPVIGMRTSGAGIWLTDRNRLADNGVARVAEFGQFDLQGRWLIEGRGVAPDIEVDNLPVATAQGGDAQLDAAIANVLQRLRETPVPELKALPLPARGTPGHDGSQ